MSQLDLLVVLVRLVGQLTGLETLARHKVKVNFIHSVSEELISLAELSTFHEARWLLLIKTR